ncbi:unnamed protein product, partial [Rotaria sp. Silwood2]
TTLPDAISFTSNQIINGRLNLPCTKCSDLPQHGLYLLYGNDCDPCKVQ